MRAGPDCCSVEKYIEIQAGEVESRNNRQRVRQSQERASTQRKSCNTCRGPYGMEEESQVPLRAG
jgi:hypothetical protein